MPTADAPSTVRCARASSPCAVVTETTFAQIVAHELGIPPEDVEVVRGATDQTPFGLGTYGSSSTPVSGAAAAVVAQRVREKARIVAAAALEVSAEDLEWDHGRWHVTGDPDAGKTIQEIAMLAHGNLELPAGVEGHLHASVVYNPPNLTYPFGCLNLRGGRADRDGVPELGAGRDGDTVAAPPAGCQGCGWVGDGGLARRSGGRGDRPGGRARAARGGLAGRGVERADPGLG